MITHVLNSNGEEINLEKIFRKPKRGIYPPYELEGDYYITSEGIPIKEEDLTEIEGIILKERGDMLEKGYNDFTITWSEKGKGVPKKANAIVIDLCGSEDKGNEVYHNGAYVFLKKIKVK